MQQGYFPNLGLQNTGQFPYHFSSQNYLQNPDIIGDGEVTSLVLPNGSFQYVFIPNLKRDLWTPYTFSPHVNNINWNFNREAWIVRNVSNPTPFYYWGQQFPRANADLQMTNQPYDHRLSPLALGYQNKFHYDQCTSTTDLHYFYPNICYPKQSEKHSACVQIDTPNTVCHYEVVCSRPCCCTTVANDKPSDERNTEENQKQVAYCMSVDNIRETSNFKESKIKCERSRNTARDKSISTCNDRGSGPNEIINKKDSLTNKRSKDSVDGGMKRSKRKSRKPRDKNSPIKIIGVCESGCCRSSSCSTDREA